MLLVIFRSHGCGRERKTRDELEIEVEDRLRPRAGTDRARTVVINPEFGSLGLERFPTCPENPWLGDRWQGAGRDEAILHRPADFLRGVKTKPDRPKKQWR